MMRIVRFSILSLLFCLIVVAPAFSAQLDLQHGIYNQEAVSDYDYIDCIRGTYGFLNPFDYIAKYTTGGTTYYNNTYKLWAMGVLKRSWIWGDTAFATRERVPFLPNKFTGIYDITTLSTSYATRFIDLLRYIATWNPPLAQNKKIIITLFEFNNTAWYNTSTASAWCKTGLCGPNDPTDCTPCGEYGSPGSPGNPWYPGNNSNNFTNLPWGRTGSPDYADDMAWEYFPNPDSPDADEQHLVNAQKAYVVNICGLIKKAYDGQFGHPAASNIEKVIIELIHEPPVDSQNESRISAWVNYFRSFADAQFNSGTYHPKFAYMVNDDDNELTYVPANIGSDLIVSEGHGPSWWPSNCSVDNIAGWIDTLNGHFSPDIGENDVFLDTDGNGSCRENNTTLNDAVVEAADDGYNFMHLEAACDSSGDAQRDTTAIKNIATEYEDYQ